jgi:RNA polymerase sigma factor (sigma-70 family)
VDRGSVGQLVTSAASGDATAWQGLVERFSGLVWSVTRAFRLGNADAADVFQTTWLRLAENIGRIEQPDRVGSWLATAARRECLQCLRLAGRAVPTDDIDQLEVPPAQDNPTEEAVLRAEQQQEDAERAVALWRAVSRLPARCHQLIRVLMASPPPSYAEVAAALGLPVGSIGPTRARCLQTLREQLVASGITGGSSPS